MKKRWERWEGTIVEGLGGEYHDMRVLAEFEVQKNRFGVGVVLL
jgi:hypothetical protein